MAVGDSIEVGGKFMKLAGYPFMPIPGKGPLAQGNLPNI
jgi:hypothetical protein